MFDAAKVRIFAFISKFYLKGVKRNVIKPMMG